VVVGKEKFPRPYRPAPDQDMSGPVRHRVVIVGGAKPGSAWLVRPDQHLCARFREIETHTLEAALERALGWELPR
jgi:hypothetical protein